MSDNQIPARRTNAARLEGTTELTNISSQDDARAVPRDHTPVLRVVPMPADANQHGDIFGGWIMSQVDIAGGIVAASYARGRVATVAVNSFLFKEPVLIGDLVSIYANSVRIGNTSITVNVEVFAERNPADRLVTKVTEATLTYVATDSQRRPRTVPRQTQG